VSAVGATSELIVSTGDRAVMTMRSAPSDGWSEERIAKFERTFGLPRGQCLRLQRIVRSTSRAWQWHAAWIEAAISRGWLLCEIAQRARVSSSAVSNVRYGGRYWPVSERSLRQILRALRDLEGADTAAPAPPGRPTRARVRRSLDYLARRAILSAERREDVARILRAVGTIGAALEVRERRTRGGARG
jgi:transcriptional regulator with XRE-family HTH domain